MVVSPFYVAGVAASESKASVSRRLYVPGDAGCR